MTTADKLGELYVAESGGRPKALPDIIALIISILLPIIQGCLNPPKGPARTKAQVASAMKDAPIAARVAVRLAMREVGCKDEAVYKTLVAAGLAAKEQDVTEFLGENEV